MGAAAFAAVGGIVALAALLELVGDAFQVACVAGEGTLGGAGEGKVVPIRPEHGYGPPGQRAADNGVEQPPRQGVDAVQAGDVEVGDGLDGNKEGGVAVFVGAEEKKQGAGSSHHGQLGGERGGEIGQQRADCHAGHRADHALDKAAFGSGIVGLAHEYGGKQYPIAHG